MAQISRVSIHAKPHVGKPKVDRDKKGRKVNEPVRALWLEGYAAMLRGTERRLMREVQK